VAYWYLRTNILKWTLPLSFEAFTFEFSFITTVVAFVTATTDGMPTCLFNRLVTPLLDVGDGLSELVLADRDALSFTTAGTVAVRTSIAPEVELVLTAVMLLVVFNLLTTTASVELSFDEDLSVSSHDYLFMEGGIKNGEKS
jgi:hypothetical protein